MKPVAGVAVMRYHRQLKSYARVSVPRHTLKQSLWTPCQANVISCPKMQIGSRTTCREQATGNLGTPAEGISKHSLHTAHVVLYTSDLTSCKI